MNNKEIELLCDPVVGYIVSLELSLNEKDYLSFLGEILDLVTRQIKITNRGKEHKYLTSFDKDPDGGFYDE